MAKRQAGLVRGAPGSKPVAQRIPAPAALPPFAREARLEAVLERGLRAIVALSGASGGAVRLLDGHESRLRLVAATGLSAEWVQRESSVGAGCGICGLALHLNRLQVDAGAASCRSRVGACLGPSPDGSALALPLHCAGRAIGVFNLFFPVEAAAGDDLSSLLGPVSDMLDLVIDNARLEEERLEASLMAERHMLANEVHDSLAQSLAYMRMRMALLHGAIEGGDRSRAFKYFGDVNSTMGEAHGALRELIAHFRTGGGQGLARALENTARTFEERTGVALRIDNRAAELGLRPEQEVQVYRIVQEALANVVKHAQARAVRVVIDRRAGKLRVSVRDDGRGVPTVAAGDGHYGLDIMRERAHRLGGELEIQSAPRKGTCVRLTLPASASAAG